MIEHTEKLIRGDFRTVDSYMKDIEELDINRSSILGQKTRENLLACIRLLLLDCRKRGTYNFSTIARMAFVGNAFLRSFVKKGAISNEAYHRFLESLETI